MTKKMTLNELLESNLSLEEIDYILEEEEDPSCKLQAPATIWQHYLTYKYVKIAK